MFYLFAGFDYYPEGGARDYQGYGVTIENARYALSVLRDRQSFDWWHITDKYMNIVEQS